MARPQLPPGAAGAETSGSLTSTSTFLVSGAPPRPSRNQASMATTTTKPPTIKARPALPPLLEFSAIRHPFLCSPCHLGQRRSGFTVPFIPWLKGTDFGRCAAYVLLFQIPHGRPARPRRPDAVPSTRPCDRPARSPHFRPRPRPESARCSARRDVRLSGRAQPRTARGGGDDR